MVRGCLCTLHNPKIISLHPITQKTPAVCFCDWKKHWDERKLLVSHACMQIRWLWLMFLFSYYWVKNWCIYLKLDLWLILRSCMPLWRSWMRKRLEYFMERKVLWKPSNYNFTFRNRPSWSLKGASNDVGTSKLFFKHAKLSFYNSFGA